MNDNIPETPRTEPPDAMDCDDCGFRHHPDDCIQLNTETDPLSDRAFKEQYQGNHNQALSTYSNCLRTWQECARRAKRYKDQLFIANAHYNESERQNKRLRELLSDCVKQMKGVVNSGMIASTYLGGIGFYNAMGEARAALEGKE